MKTRTPEFLGLVGRATPCAPPLGNYKMARRGLTRPTCIIPLLICLFILHSFYCLPALGQSYSLDWYKISGGGSSTGGPMIGTNYSVTGGFWSLYAVQTPGAPSLTITYAGNQGIVSWSPSVTGWTLQTNANLATPTWGNYLGNIVNNSATNAQRKGNLFFRLTNP